MSKTEKMLKELFDNENISIGVHGTSMIPDEEHKKAKQICEKGLMCRYWDIRRTVALQDRGMIHAHGNIDFDHLMNYNFKKNIIGYIYKIIEEDKIIRFETEQVNLEQCSFIVAIPKEMKTTDEELFCGEKQEFRMEYARSKDELKIGKDQYGRPIDPKYIVGFYMNGDINTFQYNNKFYGFKEVEKEGEVPELDLEEIKRVNEETKIKNQEKYSKEVEELGKETLEEQKETRNKNKISQFLSRQIQKIKQKSSNIERG